MLEIKDTAIKLFGKTIPLPANKEILSFLGNKGGDSSPEENFEHEGDSVSTNSQEKKSNGVQTKEKDQLSGRPSDTKENDDVLPQILVELTDPTMSSSNNENPKTPSVDEETAKAKASRTEEEQSETSSSQEKTTLKKPDKILPCPRCNSMETKFCYFNNYNVNQPRHFCKNCQRYWTAGGTMRNVPVGAGRRKNKNSVSHYRHITVSKMLQTAQTDAPIGIHHPTLKPNTTILTFGSDIPLHEPMSSVLNLTEKTMRNCGGEENGDENLKVTFATSTSIKEERRVGLQAQMTPNCHGFPPQIQCVVPGASWPYPWNSSQWTSAVPPSAFCPSNFPMSIYPGTPYWGCPVPGTWSIPWVPPPTLGKHSREGALLKPSISEKEDQPKQSNSERGVWVPKILRIDDPEESARSSIWATLGIKNNKSDPMRGEGLVKSFQSKGNEKNHLAETSQLLHANPAALSRSLNFHEIS